MKGDATMKDTIKKCLHGNGEILEQFGVKDQLGYFDTIFVQLDKAKDYFPSQNGVIPNSITIPINLDFVQKTKVGTYPDSTNTVNSLIKLSAATKTSVNTCGTGIEDTWLLKAANCTASTGTTFLTTDVDTAVAPAAACIGLDNWAANSHVIANRYTVPKFGSCPNKASMTFPVYLQTYVGNMLSHKTAVNTLFGNLETDLTAIQTANNQFMTSIYGVTAPFDAINNNVHQLYNSLADPVTGLFSNAKCTFIKTGLNNFKNAMCVGLVSSLYQTAVCIIIVSMFAFFGTFFVFCFAKRAIIAGDDEEK